MNDQLKLESLTRTLAALDESISQINVILIKTAPKGHKAHEDLRKAQSILVDEWHTIWNARYKLLPDAPLPKVAQDYIKELYPS